MGLYMAIKELSSVNLSMVYTIKNIDEGLFKNGFVSVKGVSDKNMFISLLRSHVLSLCSCLGGFDFYRS